MNKTTCGMPLIDQTGGNSLGFMDEREEARMAGWRMECPSYYVKISNLISMIKFNEIYYPPVTPP